MIKFPLEGLRVVIEEINTLLYSSEVDYEYESWFSCENVCE